MSVELYPELGDYIWRHCYVFLNEMERKAVRHHDATEKNNYLNGKGFPQHLFDRSGTTSEKDVLEFLGNYYPSFKIKVVERIFKEHYDELNLNLCPACGKIARTSFAKQCRFCYHDWH